MRQIGRHEMNQVMASFCGAFSFISPLFILTMMTNPVTVKPYLPYLHMCRLLSRSQDCLIY